MTSSDIRDAILQLNDGVLGEERTQLLAQLAPDPEEVATVSAFDGNAQELGRAEQFFLALAPIPRVANRLALQLFRHDPIFVCLLGHIGTYLNARIV